MYEDAAFIPSQASALADDGREVIIISHSYGGGPATESVRELAKDARQRLSKHGGVVRLAYMTALVPAFGSSAGNVLDMGERPKEDRIFMDADVGHSLLYHHIHLVLLHKAAKFPKSRPWVG